MPHLILAEEMREQFHVVAVWMAQHEAIDLRERWHDQPEKGEHPVVGASSEVVVRSRVIDQREVCASDDGQARADIDYIIGFSRSAKMGVSAIARGAGLI